MAKTFVKTQVGNASCAVAQLQFVTQGLASVQEMSFGAGQQKNTGKANLACYKIR